MENKRAQHSYIKNNAKEKAKQYPRQWESFKAFAERYPNACLQMDGIANPDVWDKEKIKIMTFLKDSYRKDFSEYISTFIFDICNENLEKYEFKKSVRTWMNLLKWVNAIRAHLSEETSQDLKTIAHINISKLACEGVNTRKGVLQDGIEKDGDLLYKQYQEINPNIVICGNTEKYFFDMLRREELRKNGVDTSLLEYDEKAVKAYMQEKKSEGVLQILFNEKLRGKRPLYLYIMNNIIIFSAYHPSISKTLEEDFTAVIDNKKTELLNALGNIR